MRVVIVAIVLVCYTVLLIIYTSHFKKEITCSNCDHKYIVIPKRIFAYMTFLQAAGLTVGIILLHDFSSLVICAYLAILGCYYLCKKDGYKCYSCKTINHLP